MNKEIQEIVNRLRNEGVSQDLIDSVEIKLEMYYFKYIENKKRANRYLDEIIDIRENKS